MVGAVQDGGITGKRLEVFSKESLSVEGLLNPVSNLGLDPEACGESQKGLGMEWLGYYGYKASSGPFTSHQAEAMAVAG